MERNEKKKIFRVISSPRIFQIRINLHRIGTEADLKWILHLYLEISSVFLRVNSTADNSQ